MTLYTVNVKLQGSHGKSTTKRHVIDVTGADVGAEALLVETAASVLATAWGNVSDAVVSRVWFNVEVLNDGTLPPIGSANIGERAVVSVYLTAGNGKTATVEIPAPDHGLFIGDGTEVDITNAGLTSFIGTLSAFQISDGEMIDITLGTSGMRSGRWANRATS